MTFILLGILNAQAAGGVGPQAYWLTAIGGTGADIGMGLATDSDANIYSLSRSFLSGRGADETLLVKYDTLGAVQWQRLYGNAENDRGSSVAIDSSNGVYIGGSSYNSALGAHWSFAKYNTSGTLQWQRTLVTNGNEYLNGLGTDSSDNLVLAGRHYISGSAFLFYVCKYNSSGSVQWRRSLGGSATEEPYGCFVDSADNIYVAAATASTGAGSRDAIIVKYNSAGTVQWQRILGGSVGDDGKNVAVDSSFNVFLSGGAGNSGGNAGAFLAKYNSSGTIQWQRVLSTGIASYQFTGCDVDSDGNVFVAGRAEMGSGSAFIIAKYNTSGTIQWQRTISIAGGNNSWAETLHIDAFGSVCISGQVSGIGSGDYECLVAKIPNDGSLTGSYTLDGVSVSYAASSYSAITSSMTAATSTLSDGSVGGSEGSTGSTSTSSSFTSHFVEIPA
jgi:hypothetical protein